MISSAAGENLPRFLFSGPSGLREAKAEAMEILAELPGVRLGTVQADEVRVAPSEEPLARLMQEICDRKRREFTVESLAEAPADSRRSRDVSRVGYGSIEVSPVFGGPAAKSRPG